MHTLLTSLAAVGDYFNPKIQVPLLILLVVIIVGYMIYRRRQM